MHTEFLSLHPNYDERARGFVMVKLSSEQVTYQRSQIRMSSYRWKDIKGIPSAKDGDQHFIPGNYGWFLDYLKEHKLIGWMDFLANVAVNVPVPSVIEYVSPANRTWRLYNQP